jgi:peptidoglycan pentaglycine glycine transferase (the first glycine)
MNGSVSTLYGQENREPWNTFVAQAPSGHLMQSYEWGASKAATGWRVHRVAVERDGRIVAGAQVLFRPLPWLPLTVAYIPKGPVVDLEDDGATARLLSAVHRVARNERAIFLKIEPNLPDDSHVHDVLKRFGFRSSVHTNQPRSTIVIDLSGGEDAVMARIPRKNTRKLIRRAAREGVEIAEGESQDLNAFYGILESTAEIKKIPVHDKIFYEQAWEAFRGRDSVKLLLAKYQGEIVAGKMIFVFGGRSMHFWGGTSRKGRDVYASYLIQWEAIKWAIARGCKYCDLWGIPDEIGDMLKKGQDVPKDRRSGLWGVYTFKRGFGGEIEYYAGAYDYVYRPLLYRLGVMALARNASVDVLSRWLEKFSWR